MNIQYNFKSYWKEIGKFDPQVVDNPELEESFKLVAQKSWEYTNSSYKNLERPDTHPSAGFWD